jgi:hypothetical protein
MAQIFSCRGGGEEQEWSVVVLVGVGVGVVFVVETRDS